MEKNMTNVDIQRCRKTGFAPFVAAVMIFVLGVLPARLWGEEDDGSWGRGRRVFHSEAVSCSSCHSAEAATKTSFGPHLGRLRGTDVKRVKDAITNPNAVVPRKYQSKVIVEASIAMPRSSGDGMRLIHPSGADRLTTREQLLAWSGSEESFMPAGLLEKLSDQEQLDLLAYLTQPPPSMPLKSKLTAPPLRTMAEVETLLADSRPPADPLRPLKLVLVAGPKDHGPGEHDYPAWQQQWLELMRAAKNVTVETAWEFPSDEQLADADVCLFFQKGSFYQPRPEKLDQFLNNGGGAVYIHWAVNGSDQVKPFSERIGMASWGGRIKFRHGPLTLDFHNQTHPIARNFHQLQLYDESYWKLTGNPEEITLLATSTEDGQPTPQVWVKDHQPGRVFVSIPGHYSWTFDDPLFRILLLRGIAWTASESVDRFNSLVTPGARIKL